MGNATTVYLGRITGFHFVILEYFKCGVVRVIIVLYVNICMDVSEHLRLSSLPASSQNPQPWTRPIDYRVEDSVFGISTLLNLPKARMSAANKTVNNVVINPVSLTK